MIQEKMAFRVTAMFVTVSALLAVGVVMVYSATASLSGQVEIGWQGFLVSAGAKQGILAGVSIVMMLLVSRLDYRRLSFSRPAIQHPTILLFTLSAGLLLGVLFFGIRINGARRWFLLPGGLTFQPSEFAKPMLIVFLAALLAWGRQQARTFGRGFLLPVALSALICVLIAREDLGTGALLMLVAMAMLWVSGAKLAYYLTLIIPAAAAFYWLVVCVPYRWRRLVAFFGSDQDPRGAGYHATQSLISLVSGGWWGKGLGSGVQKYGYLPQDSSDFIFAVIGEETGLIGCCVIIGFFGVLVLLGLTICKATKDPFGRLLGFGLTLLVGLQAALNIAVVTVTVPSKGIPLPYVSAGGSGALFAAVAAGLMMSVARFGASPPSENTYDITLPDEVCPDDNAAANP